ncbi:MAG: hypothetical protein ACAH89_07580 [Rariglobus sp.]|nr:hypothetical protein [Rariglobus sp.]
MPFAKLKPLGVLLLALICTSLNHAADLYTADETARQLKALQETVQAFRAGDVSVIAKHIQFPLARQYPLPSVETPEEFAQRYTDIFDASLLKLITASVAEKDWDLVGWRGYMLDRGTVWAEIDGRITGINYETKKARELRLKLIEVDRRRLHHSLIRFNDPVLKWDTLSFRLRIDDLGDANYRLALWRSDQHPQSKPALSITAGKFEREGSGGDHTYTFHLNDVTYRCDVTVLGDDQGTPKIGTFTILRKDRELLTEDVLRDY